MTTSMSAPSSVVTFTSVMAAFTMVSASMETSSMVVSGAENLFLLEVVLFLEDLFVGNLSFRLSFPKNFGIDGVALVSDLINLGRGNRLSHLFI